MSTSSLQLIHQLRQFRYLESPVTESLIRGLIVRFCDAVSNEKIALWNKEKLQTCKITQNYNKNLTSRITVPKRQ